MVILESTSEYIYGVTNSAENGIIFVSCHKTPNASQDFTIQTQYPLTAVVTVPYCCKENEIQYQIKLCHYSANNLKLKRHTWETERTASIYQKLNHFAF